MAIFPLYAMFAIVQVFLTLGYNCCQVPVDLVVDHSVQVDVARSENAVQANMELEFQRNKERFAFLKWGSNAFRNMLVVPPGSGIVHQVSSNLADINNDVIEYIFYGYLLLFFTVNTGDVVCLVVGQS